MAIALSSNLKYNGPFSNFTRDSFKTLSEMKSFEEKFLDPGHISFCEEDRNTYELTEDYIVTLNPSLTNEEVYYIKIGATVHKVIGDSTIKWQDGKSPVSEANSTIVVSVLNNLAVWGIFK